MDREEVKQEIKDIYLHDYDVLNKYGVVIDDIFDYFEEKLKEKDKVIFEMVEERHDMNNQIEELKAAEKERVCENCKSWEIFKGEFGSCKRGFNSSWLSHLHQSFGCNVFERKEG